MPFAILGCGRSFSLDPSSPVEIQEVLPSGRPTAMVEVGAGSFFIGSDDGEEEARPLHTVYVDHYFIDKFEVTVSEYRDCVLAGVCSEPATGGACNGDVSGRDDHPINCISWADANRYCSWAGKRLPTEAEWEKAARGVDGRVYPWGNHWAECDHAITGTAGLGCGEQSTWPVGSKPTGASPYGAMDMVGNVWEWVADGYELDYYRRQAFENPVNTASVPFKVLRGNSWYYSWPWVVSQTFNRFRFKPMRWYAYIGFRCVKSDRVLEGLPVDPMATSIEAAVAPLMDWMDRNRAARVAENEIPFDQTLREPEMIRIPGGPFMMGATDGDSDEMPVRQIQVSTFYLDKYEVTVDRYRKCVEAGVCPEPHSGGAGFQHGIEATYCNWGFREERANHPINCINWVDADRFCKWEGKRLPTEAEWEKAARGTSGQRYPWGDEQATCDQIVMDDGGDGCGRESTWPVGSKPAGASPYGVMDMSGNVWEWVADWYAHDFYSQGFTVDPLNHVQEVVPRRPGWGSGKVLRGGSWADQTSLIHRGPNRLSYAPDTFPDYTVGFRCARDGI
ncbi:MAG: SUMF1/EgtB/PvdO family nonheme iron enzyme [bacterium]|nr:SUMF1/EgtB/PvdO family nonheme iron enzyme [bacterium]